MSPRLRVLIADDEPLARARLRRLLDGEGDIDVIAECASGDEAIAALRQWQPDVAFLDIRMPDIDGFRVLETSGAGSRTQVVFVTAHAEHALRAFDAEAVGYLLKPLSAPRLRATLERLRRARTPTTVPASAAAGSGYASRIAVPVGARMRLLPVDEIDCLLAQANYVELHAGAQRYRLRETMGGLESRLDPGRFVRVHRSRIVRMEAIRDIELLESGQYLLRLHSGTRIATGRRYREPLRRALGLVVRS